jgi:outer membrane protein assembly factor BamA
MLAVAAGGVYIFVVWRLGYLRLALTCLMCVLFCSPRSSAQISRRLDRCLPYPSLADEIGDMREEVRAKIAANAGPETVQPTVVIDEVRFDGPIRLPAPAQEQLVAELKQGIFKADSAWLEETQWSIRGAWAGEGYFKAEPTARAVVMSADKTGQHVRLTVHVDEGLQYTLGDIQFRSSDPHDPLIFSSDELRKLVHVQEGDILHAEAIREALDAMKELYGLHGYIDVVFTPLMEFDDERSSVVLVLAVDQEKQFRLGKIEVFGPNPNIEGLLKSTLKPGDICNIQSIKNFLADNKSSLPADVSFEDIEFHRDVRSGTVDVRFNFQTCPQVQQ